MTRLSHRPFRGPGAVSRSTLAAVLIGAAGLALGGCSVNQQQYDDLLAANRAQTERVQALTQENEALKSNQSALQSAVGRRDESLSELRDVVNNLRSENLRLRDEMRQVDEALTGMDFSPIDPITSQALATLAAQYPNLMSYDPERGMIRLESDLTFPSGSDQVNESAKASLTALANVLKAPEAAGYDVRVVGHTDSQKPGANTQRNHPTNMHLSAHRAISVFAELRRLGVQAERIEVAGRGEFAPRVPNAPKGGTAANRRVEVFLVRRGSDLPMAAPANDAGAADPAPAQPSGNEDFMK